MPRPRKDPSAPPKPRKYDVIHVPVGATRSVVIRCPVGGLSTSEAQLLRNFIPVLAAPIDPNQLELDGEDFDDDYEEDKNPLRRR